MGQRVLSLITTAVYLNVRLLTTAPISSLKPRKIAPTTELTEPVTNIAKSMAIPMCQSDAKRSAESHARISKLKLMRYERRTF